MNRKDLLPLIQKMKQAKKHQTELEVADLAGKSNSEKLDHQFKIKLAASLLQTAEVEYDKSLEAVHMAECYEKLKGNTTTIGD